MNAVSTDARIDWEISRKEFSQFEDFWKDRAVIPPEVFQKGARVWFEIGAGTGGFFHSLSQIHEDVTFLAMERGRHRARALVNKSKKLGRQNFTGMRGNAVPTMIHSVPTGSLERIYILYPCPWPKNSHRKNRWYLHPIMPHILRALKPGGMVVWASDQKFYIDEARYVCDKHYKMDVLSHGEIAANEWNDLEKFNGGRTKFEADFLGQGLPCYELVVRKNDVPETTVPA